MQVFSRSIQRATLAVLTISVMAGVSHLSSQETSKSDFGLTSNNVAAWRDHIAPQAVDLCWQQIPWLTTFQDGILAADEADKPLLLWTMNGHPLGCT